MKLLTALAAAAAATAIAPGPAAAAPTCPSPPAPQQVIAELPWAQRWFQPERVWPLSTGRGVTVAVVDSGVDPRHPQLGTDRVGPGKDLLGTGTDTGTGDCDGHGTAVASLIVARRRDGVGFAGLAPDATVLPVRVADTGVDRRDEVSAADLAAAVRFAADGRARVINVSVVFLADHRDIRDAVAYARQTGALVVAAVGNHHSDKGTDATPYPAAYPGVLGVGAIGPDGARIGESATGPFVDLVAPGGDVTVAARLGGHALRSGTSYATAFVSAAAALVFATGPTDPDDVARRLLATADPAPGGPDAYGHGVVDPYRAVAERAVTGAPVAASPVPPETPDRAGLAREQRRRTDARSATTAAAVLAAAGLLLAVAGPVARRGRRGRWRPRGHVRPAPRPPVDDAQARFFEAHRHP